MAVEDWGVAIANLTGVVENDDLGGEGLGTLGRVVLVVGSDVTTLDILNGANRSDQKNRTLITNLDRDVLDVESDVVSGFSLGKRFVVHFN